MSRRGALVAQLGIDVSPAVLRLPAIMPAPDSSLALNEPVIAPSVAGGAASAASDAELVAQAVAGQRWAEAELYARHAGDVLGIATRLIGRHADAEDIAQDTFVTAFEQLAKLRDAHAFRGWLLRIAVHQVHRRFRRRKLLRKLGMDRGEDDASLAQQALPQVDAETRAELRKLDAVLAELPAGERTAWMLRHVEGLELKEIAEAADVSLATIKRWIGRAEERVAAHVKVPALGAEDVHV
jgi:RNA polymerase sigma-70 factor (ECF subfamily)